LRIKYGQLTEAALGFHQSLYFLKERLRICYPRLHFRCGCCARYRLQRRPGAASENRRGRARRLDGDGCLHDRFAFYLILGWPPFQNVLAQVCFLLDCMCHRYFSIPAFRRLVGGHCASTGAFDRPRIPQTVLDRYRRRSRDGIFRGVAAAKDHRQQAQKNSRLKSALGQTLKWRAIRRESALPGTRSMDIVRPGRLVRFVPNRRHRACAPLDSFLGEDLAFTRKGQSEHDFSYWRTLRPPLDAVLAHVADE
jgi:hypothetical protein